MATLQTGNSSLRVMPQLQQIDPRYFEGAPAAAFGAYRGGILTALDQAQLDEQQRRGQIARVIQPQQIELAQVSVGDQLANIRMNPARRQVEQIGLDRSVELAPYDTAAKRETDLRAASDPPNTELVQDDQGNLFRQTARFVNDPVTGLRQAVNSEQLKTKAQLDAEALNAQSIQDSRVALNSQRSAQAELSRARALHAAEKQALVTQRPRQFKQRAIYGDLLRPNMVTGLVETLFDPTPGQVGYLTIYRDADGNEVRRTKTTEAPPDLVVDDDVNANATSTPPAPTSLPAAAPAANQGGEPTVRFNPPANALPGEGVGAPAAQVAVPAVTVAPVSASPVAGVIQVTTDADYFALPSGAVFLDPNGQRRVKP